MKITKNQFLKWFAITVGLLAVVRLIFPSIAADKNESQGNQVEVVQPTEATPADVVSEPAESPTSSRQPSPEGESRPVTMAIPDFVERLLPKYQSEKDEPVKHPVVGVRSYKEAFPDSNDVQLTAATSLGVSPIANRHEAEMKKSELVYVGANPFFVVQKLNNSIPYLVPRASLLLQDIGRNFFDSLQVKQIPLHKIIVTSVLRTTDDVSSLRGRNRNATENSCHLYGTTFDICYNRYVTVESPDGPKRRQVPNDTLKWVLSEVLRDLRQEGRCYIKHEVKQGCFHITTR